MVSTIFVYIFKCALKMISTPLNIDLCVLLSQIENSADAGPAEAIMMGVYLFDADSMFGALVVIDVNAFGQFYDHRFL
jgi:hypothetical protein